MRKKVIANGTVKPKSKSVEGDWILNVVNEHSQGYYPDIYSAQEKWQEAGQKFRVLLIGWHLKFHLTCIV